MDNIKILKEVKQWKEENIISEEQYLTLVNKYTPKPIELEKSDKKPTLTIIILSIIIVFLGVLSLIGQKIAIFNDFVVFFSLILFSAGMISLGKVLEKKKLIVITTLGKTLLLSSGLFISFIVFYLDIKLSNKIGTSILGNDWSMFILIGGLISMSVGYLIRNNIMIGYAIFSSVIWFICQGKIYGGSYNSDWLGLTLPSRVILFSIIFIILGLIHSKKLKALDKYVDFSRTYYIGGLCIVFISSLLASMGMLIKNPTFPMKIEVLLFVLLSMTISIFLIYFGIIKSDKGLLDLGLAFLIIEVYGKLWQFLYSGNSGIIFYLIVFVIAIGMAVLIEYIVKNKTHIKEELLKGSKR